MLQDLAFGRLENEYRPVPPQATDAVLAFRNSDLLAQELPNGALKFPSVREVSGKLQYAFRLHGVNYYLTAAAAETGEYRYTPVRSLRQATRFSRRTSRFGSVIRSKSSTTASTIRLVEELYMGRFTVPWACLGIWRP